MDTAGRLQSPGEHGEQRERGWMWNAGTDLQHTDALWRHWAPRWGGWPRCGDHSVSWHHGSELGAGKPSPRTTWRTRDWDKGNQREGICLQRGLVPSKPSTYRSCPEALDLEVVTTARLWARWPAQGSWALCDRKINGKRHSHCTLENPLAAEEQMEHWAVSQCTLLYPDKPCNKTLAILANIKCLFLKMLHCR